jgi:hypothetical protein
MGPGGSHPRRKSGACTRPGRAFRAIGRYRGGMPISYFVVEYGNPATPLQFRGAQETPRWADTVKRAFRTTVSSSHLKEFPRTLADS